MTTQQITFQLPPYGTASLTLPQLLTPDAFARLDAAISAALDEPRQADGSDPIRDPGATEYDAWRVDQH